MAEASGHDIPGKVASLAQQVRELKALLASQGVAKDAINRHAEVLSKINALQSLKSQLAVDDPARDEVIHARLKEERLQRQQLEDAIAKAQREELKIAEGVAPKPLIQRKIFHLFHHTGNGDSFHYEPPARLNSTSCGFGDGLDPHPAVYLTEKWDGTTMQATSSHIFKRLDLWGKRKNADPSQRYDLRLVAWRGEDGLWHGLDFADGDAQSRQALSPYLQQIAKLDDGLCVYFEVLHTDINTTFKHLPGFASIRIFDFSQAPSPSSTANGRFLPFEETIRLADRFSLPLVGWERHERLDVALIWQHLALAAQGRHYIDVAAQLEGFVVREAGMGERIAKARVEHMLPIKPTVTPLSQSCVSCWERHAISLPHLADIGIFTMVSPSLDKCP